MVSFFLKKGLAISYKWREIYLDLAQSQQELVNAMKADYTQQLDGNTPTSQMI